VIEILPYIEGRYKGEIDVSSKLLPQNYINGDFYKASNDGFLLNFSADKLSGYGSALSLTGNTNRNILNAFVPILDMKNGGGAKTFCTIYLNEDKCWEFESSGQDTDETGIKNYTGKLSGSVAGIISIRTDYLLRKWTFFADKNIYPTGFYWICLPGTDGKSFKFWYDEDKWREKLEGTYRDIYIDNSGTVWYTEIGKYQDPGFHRDFNTNKNLVCAPTTEHAYGKNIKSIYFTSQVNPIGFSNPIKKQSGKNKLWIDTNSHFFSSTLGNDLNTGGFSTITAGTTYDYVSNISFRASGIINNYLFSDMKNGTKNITLYYKSYSSYMEGTKFSFYYDKTAWQTAFSENVPIYIDQLGAVWKNNPEEAGSSCITAPYEFLKVNQNDFFVIR
jgi:hypothetical protein